MKTTITGENKKKIEFYVKDVTLDERCEFNNQFNKAKVGEDLDWSIFVKCCLMVTDFNETTLNELTDVDIILIANECYKAVNKKKLKK